MNLDQQHIEKQSRKVFGEHHAAELSDPIIINRKLQYYTDKPYDYLGIPEGWLQDKKALDAGCGTALPSTQILLELGARVTGIDLPGDRPFDDSRLKEKFQGRYELMRGNVLDLPFADATFDYVHCQGVLHHTVNPRQGFAELARVVRPGGYVYMTVFGTSGLFREAEDFFREKYQKDEKLRFWVDNLTGELLKSYVQWTNDHLEEDIPKIPMDLFDEDLAVTIKDRLQAPLYSRHSQAEIFSWFEEEGLSPRRISRYAGGYKNFRRYFCPQYKHYAHPISQLFNGDGLVQVIGQKRLS